MANTALVTQSFAIAGTLQNGVAHVTQSFVLAAVGLGISCNNPPAGQVNVFYSHQFLSGGGEPPVVFSISAGSLPAGLVLDPATGIVSGIPTAAGSKTFTVTVTDAYSATASVVCSIVIPVDIIIQLIGWKLYPDSPCSDAVESVEPPHVERAV